MQRFLSFIYLALYLLDNRTYATLMVKLKNLIVKFTPEKLGVTDHMTKFSPLVDKMSDYVMRSYKFAETVDLKGLDEKRDALYSYLYQTIHASLKSPAPEKQTAAKALDAVMSPYYDHRTTNLSYSKETATINGFLIDAAKPENAAHIVTLGLKTEVDQLKAIQEEFSTLIESRSTNRKEVYDEKTAEVRGEIDIWYDVITDVIFAKSILEPSAELTDFIKQWNMHLSEEIASINQSQAIKAAAKKKKEDKKDDSTKPADPTTDATSETKSEPTGEAPIVTTDKDGVTTAGRPPAEATPETETPQK